NAMSDDLDTMSQCFTSSEMSLLKATLEAVGAGLLEERKRAHDDLVRVDQELRYALDRKVDKAMAKIRGEILNERMFIEREMRAMDARYRGAPPDREGEGEAP